MARKPKAAAAAAKTNGYDGDQLRTFIDRLESLNDDLASEQGSYMNRCRGIRGSKKVVYAEGKAMGIPIKVLKAHEELRKLEAKKEAIVEAIEEDENDAETFEQTAEALGDYAALPLGMAAVDRVKARAAAKAAAKSEDDDAIDGLADDEDDDPRPRFMQGQDDTRAH